MFNLSIPKTLKLATKVAGNAVLRELEEISLVQQSKGEFAAQRTELLVKRQQLKNVAKRNQLVESNHDLLVELKSDSKDYAAMETAINEFLK